MAAAWPSDGVSAGMGNRLGRESKRVGIERIRVEHWGESANVSEPNDLLRDNKSEEGKQRSATKVRRNSYLH